ncbi:phosphotransferase family protein [Paenibacillus sp. IHBB 10380]|uniref:phosphotransferase family protein n=1 Tax=Paenibacillus sp. IHBB 10380 TaxID=1566358 RepID=UPI0005CFC19D|nr:aminoglycoside phosphotransferase family protein [Paenibacillus sp. IHBB 10380]AJS57283.1 aminoglycoside phosphotransferase [Paenibacillus sp. IHBB 10380]
MKEGWERTELPTSLDLKQINQIIEPVLSGKVVVAAERLGGGFSNSNYKVHLEGSVNPYVLRLFRGEGEIADKELAISKLVIETVPVADYIYIDTSCDTFDKSWAILEWKEGILLRDVFKIGIIEDIGSAAASVGKTLANIHSYTFPQSGFFDKNLNISQPFSMDSEQFLSLMEQSLFHSPSGKWLGEELAKELWFFCQTHGSLLSEYEETPVLVHSDFNGLNILMQQSPTGYAVSAVLDWEFAFSWRRYADIANMLRYEEDGSIFEQHFIQAYQDHGGILEGNWKLLSKLEDLVSLCDILNHSTMDTPNRIRDVRRLIAKTVKNY